MKVVIHKECETKYDLHVKALNAFTVVEMFHVDKLT